MANLHYLFAILALQLTLLDVVFAVCNADKYVNFPLEADCRDASAKYYY